MGYTKLQGEDLNYLGVSGLRIAGSQGVLIIAVCQVCGLKFAESSPFVKTIQRYTHPRTNLQGTEMKMRTAFFGKKIILTSSDTKSNEPVVKAVQ